MFLFTVLLTTGCEQTFEPLQENDGHFFSIFGFLDASADTQWVRVTPVKDTIWLDPAQHDYQVTLEEMGTGEVTLMEDSLFNFLNLAYVYNFWTTRDLEPDKTYKLTATRGDGEASSVSITLPPDYPTPLYSSGVLEVEGVERLADVKILYHFLNEVTGGIKIYPLPKLYAANRRPNGNYIIYLGDTNRDRDWRTSNFPVEGFTQVGRQIYVAAAGPGWPNFVEGEAAGLPYHNSNVEQGVGFTGGIVSKTLPFRGCLNEFFRPEPCPLEK